MNSVRTLVIAAGIAAILGWAGIACAQEDAPALGAHGQTRGVVLEQTGEYLLVRPDGESPRRMYMHAPSTAAAPAPSFKPGDFVDVQWTYDGRREIDQVKAAAPPATAPMEIPEPVKVAETQPAATMAVAMADGNATAAPAGATLGERVNALIDDLVATGNRLLELPLVVLIGGAAVGGVLASLAARRLFKKRISMQRTLGIAIPVAAGIVGLLIIDRKIAALQQEVGALRASARDDRTALLESLSKKSSKRDTFYADSVAVNKALTPSFGEVSIRPLIYDEASDVYQVHTNTPLTQIWIAEIDLTNPGVQIKLQADFNTKTLTSVFAKDNGCSIAINGEAGTTPEQGSGLGGWRGFMVKDGQLIMKELAGNPRPYLSFDAHNHASFTSIAAADRSPPTGKPTVIWGRWDALVGGKIQPVDERNRQPRTAMGINADGTRLFLLVVDGRQQRYSMGLSHGEVGTVLKAFGATDAMLCDEGGSSCMYLDQFGGIANVPSDNNGQERVTYTHFGIAMKKP